MQHGLDTTRFSFHTCVSMHACACQIDDVKPTMPRGQQQIKIAYKIYKSQDLEIFKDFKSLKS